MSMTHHLIISPEQLLALPKDQTLVFDCSFDLMQPHAGRAAFEAEHIANARYACLDADLSAHHGEATASGGRHPLPTREAFAAWAAAQGITPTTQVVVYDRNGNNFCGRLWWMLRWAGHEAVAILDGGLAAWKEAGGSTESGAASPYFSEETSKIAMDSAREAIELIAIEAMRSGLKQGNMTIIDARAQPRFKGDVEPLDPIAGHIPGALNRPFANNFQPNGRFKSAAILHAEFSALLAGQGNKTIVHHCGSGVSAVPNLVAMELAGLSPSGPQKLYAGGWSEWCRTPGTAVAQG